MDLSSRQLTAAVRNDPPAARLVHIQLARNVSFDPRTISRQPSHLGVAEALGEGRKQQLRQEDLKEEEMEQMRRIAQDASVSRPAAASLHEEAESALVW